jgi:acyl carrier protein
MDNIFDFTRKFQNQYIDADTFEMHPETEFRQVGSWDSLTGMAVLFMVKDEYGVDITVENFREMKTVNDVYTFIQSVK